MTVYKGTNLIAGVPDLTGKADNNAVVHKTGTETIEGNKTFTSSIYRKNTNMNIDVNPESQINNQIWFTDKNDNLYATLQANQNTNGSVGFSLTMKSRTSNSYATLSVGQFTDGTSYTIAPASDMNNSIVTTVSKSKATNGYFKLGNGLIIQWGRVSGILSNQETTVTFPTAFTSGSSYTIVKNYQSQATSTAADREMSFYAFTTTTAKTYTSYADTSAFSWIAIGY